MRKLKIRNYADSKNKNMSDVDKEIKRVCIKNYFLLKNKLLNHLINRVEKVDKVF